MCACARLCAHRACARVYMYVYACMTSYARACALPSQGRPAACSHCCKPGKVKLSTSGPSTPSSSIESCIHFGWNDGAVVVVLLEVVVVVLELLVVVVLEVVVVVSAALLSSWNSAVKLFTGRKP